MYVVNFNSIFLTDKPISQIHPAVLKPTTSDIHDTNQEHETPKQIATGKSYLLITLHILYAYSKF